MWRRFGSHLPLLLLALVLGAGPSATDARSSLCQPSRRLRDALADLDPRADACLSSQPCWREKIARAEGLLEKHPDEFHLHRAYQTLVMRLPGPERETEMEKLTDRYGQRARERALDPVAQYLYGRLQATKDEERERYEHSVELDPGFPWGHWGIGVTSWDQKSDDGSPRDQAAAEEQMATFMRLCPSRFQEPLTSSQWVGRPEFWRERLPALRSALETARNGERVLYLKDLWQLEFRVTPPVEHARIRVLQRGDLSRIERLRLESNPRWWETLDAGYRQVGDQEAHRRFQERMMAARPCSDAAVKARLKAWSDRHGGERPPKEGSAALSRETYDESAKWIRMCPEDLSFSLERFGAASELDDLPDGVVLAEVDRHLNVWERNKDRASMFRTPYFEAADLLLERGLDLERVPILLRKEIEVSEGATRISETDGFPESMRADVRRSQALREVENNAKLAEACLRLGRAAEAEDALVRSKADLDLLQEDPGMRPKAMFERIARFWHLRGEAAEALDRKLDAVAFYRRGQAVAGDDILAERGARLWKELGGSDASWEAFVPAAPQAPRVEIKDVAATSRWVEKSEPLARFELTDLASRTWRSDELKGKAVLINVWATWCAPCVAELPYIQRLHEKVAGDPGIAILTLNVDSNPGLVAPYVEKEGLSLPVLLAERYVTDLQGGLSIPQNWIVDPLGIVRRTQRGFSEQDAQVWVEETLAALREMAAARGR